MSAFIVKADYQHVIKNNILDRVTTFTDALLDEVERYAIEYIKGHLNARYDVDSIFSETGTNRNPLIVMYTLDVVLYNIHARINYRKIPDFRKERYTEAKEWLMMVKAAKINPPNLPVPANEEKDYILFGGNTKRDNQF